MGMRRRARRRGLIVGAAVGATAAHHRDRNEAEEQQAYDQTDYAPPPADPTDQLEHLAQLHASGALTDEEFAAAKAKVIGA
jgi:Short C-terminal domain